MLKAVMPQTPPQHEFEILALKQAAIQAERLTLNRLTL
jgi:hypothetical protein